MFTVRVETMPGLELGFRACLGVAINKSTGDVIVDEEDEPLLHKFHLQQNGSYREEWRRQHPENVRRYARKYLTDTGCVILQNEEDAPTFVFDQEMKLIDSWQHQGDQLIATLPGTRAVYAVKEGRKWWIKIRIKDGEVLQLKPDGSTWEYNRLSVCEDARTGKLAVIFDPLFSNSSLDIFSQDGKTKQRILNDSFYKYAYQCLCMRFKTPIKPLFLDVLLDTRGLIHKTQDEGAGDV